MERTIKKTLKTLKKNKVNCTLIKADTQSHSFLKMRVLNMNVTSLHVVYMSFHWKYGTQPKYFATFSIILFFTFKCKISNIYTFIKFTSVLLEIFWFLLSDLNTLAYL